MVQVVAVVEHLRHPAISRVGPVLLEKEMRGAVVAGIVAVEVAARAVPVVFLPVPPEETEVPPQPTNTPPGPAALLV